MGQVSRRAMLAGSAAVAMGSAASGQEAAAAARRAPLVVTPGDPRYPDLVRGSNWRWQGRPEAVRLVTGTGEVVAAVRDAAGEGKRLAVRSGGHCYEDFVFNPEVKLVIDMSEMNAVSYDPDRAAFVIEAGATLFDAYQTLYRRWGVTVPGGLCHSVGAGGHICGGGYGQLSRRYGLVVDHLWGVEVVVADRRGGARAVLATREDTGPRRELWWAHTGGGGGNFGVVTRYFLRTPGTADAAPGRQLPRPPAQVFLHNLAWRWSDMDQRAFHTVVRNYGDWLARNSQPDTPYTGLTASLNLSTRASGEFSLFTQLDATLPNARRLLEDFLNAVTAGVRAPLRPATVRAGEIPPAPGLFTPRAMPWLLATRNVGDFPWTTHGDYKSAYLRTGFPDEQIAVIHRYLTSPDASPGDLLQLASYGGAINTVAPGATAAAQRDSIMKLQYQCYWEDPAEEARRVGWLREFYATMYQSTGGVPVPGEITDGCYVNYADADLSDPRWNTSDTPWHGLYYKDDYPRLQRVKARWDPTDTFRHAQSVRLPSG